jgi:signal-transduction protein with cAMP-binding, CBS, and nucleotidyltransferase domain
VGAIELIRRGGALMCGCSSKDLLMKVIAQGLSPESTTMDKVMTPNPECAGLDTTLVDALHIMHDGKFLHLPVVDQGMHMSCTLLNFLIQV